MPIAYVFAMDTLALGNTTVLSNASILASSQEVYTDIISHLKWYGLVDKKSLKLLTVKEALKTSVVNTITTDGIEPLVAKQYFWATILHQVTKGKKI